MAYHVTKQRDVIVMEFRVSNCLGLRFGISGNVVFQKKMMTSDRPVPTLLQLLYRCEMTGNPLWCRLVGWRGLSHCVNVSSKRSNLE